MTECFQASRLYISHICLASGVVDEIMLGDYICRDGLVGSITLKRIGLVSVYKALWSY